MKKDKTIIIRVEEYQVKKRDLTIRICKSRIGTGKQHGEYKDTCPTCREIRGNICTLCFKGGFSLLNCPHLSD